MPPTPPDNPESEKELLRRLQQISDKDLTDVTAGLSKDDLKDAPAGGPTFVPEDDGASEIAGPVFMPEPDTLQERSAGSTSDEKLQRIVDLLDRNLERIREIMEA